MPEQAPDGSIIISPKEFYDGVRTDVDSIKSSIARVETAVSPLPTRLDKVESRVDKAEDRIDAVERKLAYYAGAGAAVGAVAASLITQLLTR